MNKHFELIHEMCEVISFKEDELAIYYKDGGRGYAEINGAVFPCSSEKEFEELIEMFGDETWEE